MNNYRFVSHLPDLILPKEYSEDPQGKRIRIRIKKTGDGIEVMGDAMRPAELDKLLEFLGPENIEKVLCG